MGRKTKLLLLQGECTLLLMYLGSIYQSFYQDKIVNQGRYNTLVQFNTAPRCCEWLVCNRAIQTMWLENVTRHRFSRHIEKAAAIIDGELEIVNVPLLFAPTFLP